MEVRKLAAFRHDDVFQIIKKLETALTLKESLVLVEFVADHKLNLIVNRHQSFLFESCFAFQKRFHHLHIIIIRRLAHFCYVILGDFIFLIVGICESNTVSYGKYVFTDGTVEKSHL